MGSLTRLSSSDRLTEVRDRYREPWLEAFYARATERLRPGAVVLDVGAGRRPAIPKELRPVACHYVALDSSQHELEAAPPGSYDRCVVRDVTQSITELEDRFDLIVSWQVLEHVRPVEATLRNLHTYLRPGGRLVAQISGRNSVFAAINRILPYRVTLPLLCQLLSADPEEHFPAYYDQCSDSDLRRALAGWCDVEIVPRYRGAEYFGFSHLMQRAYLLYEDRIAVKQRCNFATHYLLSAVRWAAI